ncbi:MAG: DUF1343 domain-containing protein [Cyclobacteriaceae bacterium]|nr:DUF1343 domain-containing protein [Cyclobacteriaceae bacterium]
MFHKLVSGILAVLLFCQCSGKGTALLQHEPVKSNQKKEKIVVGAAQLDVLLPMLSQKRVGLVVNYTAQLGKTHLADTLLSRGVNIKKIFAPEHGFRGNAANGEDVKDGVDTKTKLPIISIYGKSKKPSAAQLADIDILIFDIQDVGARFYTYISSMHYVMEACAENNKQLIILDRPNPNPYVDGPILQPDFKSFVGMHPIPIVHGLTIGELAEMINGEGWLAGNRKCELTIIPLKNWAHADDYSLPVQPSPNLPNDQSIRLYPSLCLFEGTVVSLGRGTPKPFQVLGHPELKGMPYQFTPVTIPGVALNPPNENTLCYGVDLSNEKVERKLNLHYLIDFYQAFPDKPKFFINYFNTLAGNATLQQQIKDNWSEEQIRESWKKDLDTYNLMRKKYLIYP